MNDDHDDHHENHKPRTSCHAGVSDQVMKGVMALIVPWSVWVTHNVYEMLAMHDSDFTSEDAHHLEGEVMDEIKDISDKVWELEKEISSDYVKESELKMLLKKD